MDDLISRSDAIGAVKEERFPIDSDYAEGFMAALDKVEWILKEWLPSAQPEPCGDVVSRNAIVQKLNEMDRYVSTELRLCDTDKKFPQNEVFIVNDVYEEIVEQLPSAQPDLDEVYAHAETEAEFRYHAERKKGEWIKHPKFGVWECDQCGTRFKFNFKYHSFCPNCGADMREGAERRTDEA